MKKLFLILLLALALCACGVSEEPDFEETILVETNPGENCTLPEEEENNEPEIFEERMEYEDFYTALVEIKGGILSSVQDSVLEFSELGKEVLWNEYHLETYEIPKILSTEDFSIRKTYEQDGKTEYYAAVPVKNNLEIRLELLETAENKIKIWEPGETKIAALSGEEEFYDWELSDIPTPKNYPTSLQIGKWNTNYTDWFGQSNPFDEKYGRFDHLECRNWKNYDEYITASVAVPFAYMPDIERAFGQIEMKIPERIFFSGSIIHWDGNFGEYNFWGGPAAIKIGEMRFFEQYEEPEESVFSGKTESEEIGLDKIKTTEKYIRTFGDIYSSGKVELVDYRVNLGGGFGVSVYFYISESLTPEDIEIYDRIVESMVFVDMR